VARPEALARIRRSRTAASSTWGRRLLSQIGAYQSGGLLVALIGLGAFFTSASPNFLTVTNLKVVLLTVSIVGLVAVPQAMLLLAGFLDLSVGSVAVLAAIVFGQMMQVHDASLGVSIVVALLVGAGWGLLNGVLVGFFGFSPVIVTLGGFAGARGIADAISKDVTQFEFGDAFGVLGNGEVAGIPVPVVIFIGCFLAGAYLWYETPLGRHLTAIGADRTAARSLGVAVKRIPAAAYVASGLAAAAGGLILTSELDGASPSIGVGLELEVLTGVLLGGVAFSGGRGSLWGVLFGVLFVGVLDNGLILLNVGPYYVNVAVGGVLIAAAAIDVLYQRLERLPIAVEEQPRTQEQSRAVADARPQT
jgi:ribose/xylose/arabinose/galactoside ABC-type transport system permease subunit